LITSFEKQFHNITTQILYTEINDHGVHWVNTGQILAQWQRPVASRVALYLPYWVMHSASYRLTRMVFKMESEAGACFSFFNFMSCIV
jgi:hypothetical protein